MLVDSHAHLDDRRFSEDLDDVLARAGEAGVRRIVTVGTGIPSCEKAVAMARRHPDSIIAAVGLDPHRADEVDDSALGRLAELARDPVVVAVGETGLEYHHRTSSHVAQKKVFEAQIGLALDADLPLIIHCREAFDDCLAILRSHRKPSLRGVAHCFSGGVAEAEAFLELGFLISFSGVLTFPNAEGLREVARNIPLDKALIETDCPYLAPQSKRGRRNEPAYVMHVAESLAKARNIPLAEVVEASSANAARLFGVA